MLVLSNDWMIWFWKTYSIAIMLIPTVVGFLLKLVAIFHPKVPTDQITQLIGQYWPKGKM